MLVYPDPDPVAFAIGSVAVHWYGLMYLAGFAAACLLGRRQAHRPWSPLAPPAVEDLIGWAAVGVIAGGRLGYLVFYQPGTLSQDPLLLLRIWEGGMSFHGGLLGVVVAGWLFARRRGIPVLALGDFVALLVPLGLAAGRLGNFINGELWGKATSLPWGMVGTGLGPEPRHPSMLYEMLLEGIALFLLLYWLTRRPRPTGVVTGVFLTGYAVARIGVEFVRLPDSHIGYLLDDWLTMGHILSLPMLAVGLWLIVRRPPPLPHGPTKSLQPNPTPQEVRS